MKSLLIVGFLYLTILNALAANANQKNIIGSVNFAQTVNGNKFVQPWPGVTVRLVRANGNREVARTKTNSTGAYVFNNVQAGSYVAVTTCPNAPESREPVLVGNTQLETATFTSNSLHCGL